MRVATFLALATILAAPAAAETVDQPKFTVGDIWVYHSTVKTKGVVKENQIEISISRDQGDMVLVAVKEVGSDKPPAEALTRSDWGKLRSVNGVETIVNRPFVFPLDVGKTWKIDFADQNPKPNIAREEYSTTYTVKGWEQVKTAAGEFKALKIEAVGAWIAEIPAREFNNAVVAQRAPGLSAATTSKNVVAAQKVTGRIYKLFYYAPAVKRWVKSIEESYGPDGQLMNSSSDELASYHAGG